MRPRSDGHRAARVNPREEKTTNFGNQAEIAAETAVPAVIEEGRPDNIPNLIGCPQSQCGDLLLTERMLQVPDAR